MPLAFIMMAGGLGDVVRATPLVRVCGALGYEIDLLVAADCAGTDALLREAPEVRRVIAAPSPRLLSADARSAIARDRYDVAIFTALANAGRPQVRAAQVLSVDRSEWLTRGDIACAGTIAGRLGWTGPLPPPFVIPSSRVFDLEPGTIALHPGCKSSWSWKKWHGFDVLAARLPRVVIVGTPADLDNRATYFHHGFAWPPHARSFVGELDLADTAALLCECAALVANDSGLMHVGAALGIPVFGVFGITSPDREAMPVVNMIPVSKGLDCEPACRRGPWGRRDCGFHLECLRSLQADEVLGRVRAALPDLLEPEACAARP